MGGRDVVEILFGCIAEGSAGSGEDELDGFAAFASAQALVSTIVFAVDGEKICTVEPGGGHDEFPARDEHFLVG